MQDYQAQQPFDRFFAAVEGLPGVTSTKPTAVTQALPLVGNVTNVTIQTFRSDEHGFTVALTVVDADGTTRILLPDKVAKAIYRQRQSLTDRSTPASRARKRASRETQRRRQEKVERKERWARQGSYR